MAIHPFGKAQQVPIGQWRSHLPYSNAIAVAEAGDKIYCATHTGLFYYSKADQLVQRISKIDGLAEVQISAMKYHREHETLVIGYSSGNIDLIVNNEVLNLPYIKNKNITGGKGINNISIVGTYAYLCCDFGIVVLNLEKQEISDTYYLGPSGNPIKVFDLTFDNAYFFVATEAGVFKGLASNPFLTDYQSWTAVSDIPTGMYNSITYYQGNVYANYILETDTATYDTLFVENAGNWHTFNWANDYAVVRRVETSRDFLVLTNSFSSSFYDANGSRIHYLSTYDQGLANPFQAIIDSDDFIWIADDGAGLVRNSEKYTYTILTPNGPSNNSVWSMSEYNGVVGVATGAYEANLTPSYTRNGFHLFRDEQWVSYNERNIAAFDSIHDIVCLAIDPRDPLHVFAGSWGKGLLEFYNGALQKIYGNDGVSLIVNELGSSNIYVGGLFYDSDNNLWITNSGTASPIVILLNNGSWQRMLVPGYPIRNHSTSIVVDQNKQKWVAQPRGGGLVSFAESPPSTEALKMDSLSGNIFSICSDRLGQLWVGTSEGAQVINAPGGALEKIYVQQDGHTEYLLETETITAIAVDGANRKWIGTAGGGVFLMSADGTQELVHFSEENSPLFSNIMRSIAIDRKSGEVFFGTDKGIISFRGTATDGHEDMDQVLVFPNPVREDYNGLIGIKGLTENADVKITDIAGNLVFATIAFGGQAVWDGKTASGKKAQTGVYLVFCSNADGKKRSVAKIFFVN